MKEIKLTKGFVAMVDDDDFENVRLWKWYVMQNGSRAYAARREGSRHIFLHRFLLGLVDSKFAVDHINGNGLDNRRSNLRIADASQNGANRRKNVSGSSRFKGVIFEPRGGAYVAKIKFRGKKYYLGTFSREEDAAVAYDNAAKRFWGEYARTNYGAVDNVVVV